MTPSSDHTPSSGPRGRERRRMAVAEDHTSTPTNSPHLHRAETWVAAAQGKGVADTLQTGAVSGFGCMAFTPPISKTQRMVTLSTHKEAQLNHVPTTGGERRPFQLCWHSTKLAYFCPEHWWDASKAYAGLEETNKQSRDPQNKLHVEKLCEWSHWSLSPTRTNNWTGWLEGLYKFSTLEDPPKLWQTPQI